VISKHFQSLQALATHYRSCKLLSLATLPLFYNQHPYKMASDPLPSPSTDDLPVFLCVEFSLDTTLQQKGIVHALSENPQNAVRSVGSIPDVSTASPSDDPLPSALVVNVTKYWKCGSTLKIKFLNGDANMQKRVSTVASAWSAVANINFKWVAKDSPAQIRISFVTKGGSNSTVGTDALLVKDQSAPTMKLEIGPASSEKEVRRAVLHEFGHALGCEHEHQSHRADLDWDSETVYAYCADHHGWSRDKVDRNILKKIPAKDVSASAYDPKSIMLYEYPGNWFKSSGRIFSAACNWLEVSTSESDIHVGEFVLPPSPGTRTTAAIKFPESFIGQEPPIVICWFSALHMGKDAPWRIKTYPTDISTYKFRLNIDRAAETDLRGATVSWVAFPRLKQGITGGFFSTDEIPGPENAGRVEFDGEVGFKTGPQIVMGLNGLDFENGANLRIRLSSAKVDAKGWDWRLDSWSDSKMNSATGSYVAIAAPEVDASETGV
jgi:hypothetical protein